MGNTLDKSSGSHPQGFPQGFPQGGNPEGRVFPMGETMGKFPRVFPMGFPRVFPMGAQIPHVFPHGGNPLSQGFPHGFPQGETHEELKEFTQGFPHGGSNSPRFSPWGIPYIPHGFPHGGNPEKCFSKIYIWFSPWGKPWNSQSPMPGTLGGIRIRIRLEPAHGIVSGFLWFIRGTHGKIIPCLSPRVFPLGETMGNVNPRISLGFYPGVSP